MGGAALLIYLVIFVGIIYMFVVIPQRKLRRQQAELMSKLSAGDEVVTTAGIYGTVTELEDAETLLLEVAEGTEIRIARAAVAKIIVDVPATDVVTDGPSPDADPDAGTA
ncbi:MAG: preprotein translocase subunit YajC [Thermoleophilia bacterium]|nr:preprotein translocase subunit YajC [Thermoleophilia bacterium]